MIIIITACLAEVVREKSEFWVMTMMIEPHSLCVKLVLCMNSFFWCSHSILWTMHSNFVLNRDIPSFFLVWRCIHKAECDTDCTENTAVAVVPVLPLHTSYNTSSRMGNGRDAKGLFVCLSELLVCI